MRNLWYAALLFFLPLSGQQTENSVLPELLNAGGVLVEKLNRKDKDPNRYTRDNTIYKPGYSFEFSFKHIDPQGEIALFKSPEGTRSWEFVPVSDSTVLKDVVNAIRLIPMPGTDPELSRGSEYRQTLVSYRYLSEGNPLRFGEITGLIENQGNVWLHPPRVRYFRILELNPFPFIKAPYQVGNAWEWDLKIGDHWSDERWKTWKGRVQMKYKYQITENLDMQTELGILNCYRIESTASSRLGVSRLTAYFNLEYGFVRLHYTNIDGSQTILELLGREEE